MNANVHVELCCLVYLLSMILCAVHKKTTHDALTNVRILVVFIYAVLFVVNIDLYSLHKAS